MFKNSKIYTNQIIPCVLGVFFLKAANIKHNRIRKMWSLSVEPIWIFNKIICYNIKQMIYSSPSQLQNKAAFHIFHFWLIFKSQQNWLIYACRPPCICHYCETYFKNAFYWKTNSFSHYLKIIARQTTGSAACNEFLLPFEAAFPIWIAFAFWCLHKFLALSGAAYSNEFSCHPWVYATHTQRSTCNTDCCIFCWSNRKKRRNKCKNKSS